jgi:hypothetical protein
MFAAMEDRDLMTVAYEPSHDSRSYRAGATDYQNAHLAYVSNTDCLRSCSIEGRKSYRFAAFGRAVCL